MADIAEKLGISQATVSMALNNSPRISEATRKRVRDAAREIGYRTNPYISALMSARRHGKNPADPPTVAIVTANATPDGWRNIFHQLRFIDGLSVTAQSLGIRTEHFCIGSDGMTAKKLNNVLHHRGIRGAVLMPQGPFLQCLDYQWHDIATVVYGIHEFTHPTDRVVGNLYANMELALSKLREEGFRRIGFVMDPPFPYARDNLWLSAYLMAQNRGTIARIKPWLPSAPSFEGFKTWITKADPHAIVCLRAQTIIDWLHRLGLKVPADISVVTINQTEDGAAISGIVENSSVDGKFAMTMLLDRIHHSEFGTYTVPRCISVNGCWNSGKTLLRRSQ